MSTPNPTHIIAQHAQQNDARYCFEKCLCGWTGFRKDHAAHVVSKLKDAGYSIVQLPELDDLDCVSAAPGSGKVRCYLDDARMTAEDARDLAGLLLAAAAAAEGEKP